MRCDTDRWVCASAVPALQVKSRLPKRCHRLLGNTVQDRVLSSAHGEHPEQSSLVVLCESLAEGRVRLRGSGKLRTSVGPDKESNTEMQLKSGSWNGQSIHRCRKPSWVPWSVWWLYFVYIQRSLYCIVGISLWWFISESRTVRLNLQPKMLVFSMCHFYSLFLFEAETRLHATCWNVSLYFVCGKKKSHPLWRINIQSQMWVVLNTGIAIWKLSNSNPF